MFLVRQGDNPEHGRSKTFAGSQAHASEQDLAVNLETPCHPQNHRVPAGSTATTVQARLPEQPPSLEERGRSRDSPKNGGEVPDSRH